MADVMQSQKIESFTILVWKRFKKHQLALISTIILIILGLVSIFAPTIEYFLGVSHDTASLSMVNMPASWPHILGTNELGQDVFTRLIFGGRISLSVGLISALTSAIIGSVIGLCAGFFGGFVDSALMRFTDAMLSVPVLPLMIVFSALELDILFGSKNLVGAGIGCLAIAAITLVFRYASFARKNQSTKDLSFFRMIADALIVSGTLFIGYVAIFYFIDWKSVGSGNFSSVIKLILIIVFFGWMTVARLARAAAMQLKNMEFVTAVRALGANNKRMLLVHILPNALAPIIVAATLEVGGNILYEAALSFLGLGIQPPVSSWGNMLNNAVDYIKTTPSLAFWPGFFILVTVACFNFLGDGMRDALDPHQVMKSGKK
ncbi:ABC transporter permease [Sulfobacillus acidophilus]|uniref:ABC transporter permease n=1 Tax=Sulfobacillus acidophilus TaxID=53633 RepID=A0ABS3AVM5_9FIRM|nr:ABC transporter permease [Sulfobacillus acidophilus]